MKTARAAALVLASLAMPAAASSQTTISARAADITLGGRLHSQYSVSSVAAAENDFFLRRVRLIADVELNDFFSARVQPDFAGGQVRLQDTYVRFAFDPAFRVSMGQMKRAFDLFELASSTDLSIIERDGRVEGVDQCTGVGGVCSYSRLIQKLRYSERDQGVAIDGSRGSFSYRATVTNGTGINVADENDAKSYSFRSTLATGENVRVSGQVGFHDYVDPSDQNAIATAYGGDVEVGSWRDGLHVQASAITGENWQNLDASDAPSTFLALQAVATFYSPLANSTRFVAVEPVARISFADPDRDAMDDAAIVLTPGVMLYMGGKNEVGVNVDVYSPQTGGSEWSLKVQSFLYF